MEMEEGEYEMVEEGESWSEHPSQEEVVVYPSGDEGVEDGSNPPALVPIVAGEEEKAAP